MRSHGSSVSVMSVLWAGQPGNWGLILSRRKSCTSHSPDWFWCPQSLIQWIPDIAEKQRRCEAHCSFLSNAKVKNAWGYTSTTSYICMVCYLLVFYVIVITGGQSHVFLSLRWELRIHLLVSCRLCGDIIVSLFLFRP